MRRRGEGFERAVKLTHALLSGQTLTKHEIVSRWGVTKETAMQDLRDLAELLPVATVSVPSPARRGPRLVRGLRRAEP